MSWMKIKQVKRKINYCLRTKGNMDLIAEEAKEILKDVDNFLVFCFLNSLPGVHIRDYFTKKPEIYEEFLMQRRFLRERFVSTHRQCVNYCGKHRGCACYWERINKPPSHFEKKAKRNRIT